MFWYLLLMGIVLCVMLLCAIGKHYGYKTIERQFILLSSVPLIFFMAFRESHVGIDTLEYVRAFSQIREYTLFQALFAEVYGRGRYTLLLEPGYRLFNWIVGLFSKNDQAIIVFGSLLIISLLTHVCKKESSAPMLSLFMYLTLGIFQTHMNVSRNAMAIFICYYGFKYIESKRLWRFLLCVMIGCSFHFSVILLIPLYWLVNYVSFDNKNFRKILVSVFAFTMVFPLLKDLFVRIVPAIYRGYFLRNTEDRSGILVGLFYLLLFVISILFVKKGERYKVLSDERTGTWMLLLNTFFFSLSFSMGNAARAAALFGPYIIIYIPQLLDKVRKKGIARAIVIILCIGIYIARMSVNNIGRTMPFQFCF